VQSKEFREILMTKMRNFDFENGSTACTVDDIDWSFSSINFYYVFGVMLPTFRIKTTL
jgi:hypothetical protein